MTKRLKDPKTTWERKPNTGPGQRVGNKYNFSQVLKKVGDFVETHCMPREDMMKVKYAAHIWAFRKHCRISTCIIYCPCGDYAIQIEVISHTRK